MERESVRRNAGNKMMRLKNITMYDLVDKTLFKKCKIRKLI
jgi:hypothetical protein